MADGVDGTLEATGSVGEQIGIISDTHSSDAVRPKEKTKVGAVEGEETRIDIHFEVSTSSDVALPVALVLHHLPAELVIQLDMALCVPVGTLAILEDVTTLTSRVQLSELDFSL